MGGIQAIGNTFNLPNFHGPLINLSPVDTPLLSMSGGLNAGGGLSGDYEFEWQTYDLRNPQARPRLEGADAPDPEARTRTNASNLVQIFQETVGTTYTRRATAGRYAASSLNSEASADNPVRDEHAWQVQQAVTQIARDLNYVMWYSEYHKPADNTTARQTRGLIQAAATNARSGLDANGAAGEDLATATDTVTEATTPVSNGDAIVITEVSGANVVKGRTYYVRDKASGTFKLAATPGGPAITLGTGTISYATGGDLASAAGPDLIGEWMQQAWTNGGLSGQETSTLFIPAAQKRRFTKGWASQYATDPFAGSRDVAGLNVQTVETDFGRLNLVLERTLADDTIALVDLSQVRPVFLSIPNKGVLFEEELAKTGATDKTMIYGEIGLDYGDERRHAVLTGLRG